MRNHLAPNVRGFFFALLLLLATAVPVAADDILTDVTGGLSYDALNVTVLGYSPLVEGEVQAMVLSVRWSDGRFVLPDSGVVLVIARWPRAEGDSARALDSVGYAKTTERGIAIVGYSVPSGVLLPSESVVSATLEVSSIAFRNGGWPAAGWDRKEMTVAVGRN